MNKRQKIHWVLLDLFFVIILISGVFETIRDGYSWWWFALCVSLVLLVNVSIMLSLSGKETKQ